VELARWLEVYRTFSPAAWVGVYRQIPVSVGLGLVAAGLLLLVFGGGRPFRIVAGPLGASAGYAWGTLTLAKLGFHPPEEVTSLVLAGLLGVAGLALPPVAVFCMVGFPAGMLAGQFLPPGDWLLAFLPAFLLLGGLAAIFHRSIGSAVAACVGSWVLCLGALAALRGSHEDWVAPLAREPWGVIIAAVLFAVAGTVYQLFIRPSPEVAEAKRQERLKAKKRAQEKKALEKRWAHYSEEKSGGGR